MGFFDNIKNWASNFGQNIAEGMGYTEGDGQTGTGSGIGNILGDVRDYFTGWRQTDLNTETHEYNKELQEKQWNREDTAWSRKVADLKAAGLSPVLAAGGSGSPSTAMKLNAPEHKGREASQASIAQISQLMQMKADISKTKAQEELIKKQSNQASAQARFIQAQTDKVRQDTSFGAELHPGNIEKQLSENKVLSETVWNRIWTIRSQEAIADTQARIARIDERLKGFNINQAQVDSLYSYLEHQWMQQNWTTDIGTPSSDFQSRYALELATKQILLEQAQLNKKWTPILNSTKVGSSVISAAGQIIP